MCFIFYVVVSRGCGKQPGVTQGLDAFKKANLELNSHFIA